MTRSEPLFLWLLDHTQGPVGVGRFGLAEACWGALRSGAILCWSTSVAEMRFCKGRVFPICCSFGMVITKRRARAVKRFIPENSYDPGPSFFLTRMWPGMYFALRKNTSIDCRREKD